MRVGGVMRFVARGAGNRFIGRCHAWLAIDEIAEAFGVVTAHAGGAGLTRGDGMTGVLPFGYLDGDRIVLLDIVTLAARAGVERDGDFFRVAERVGMFAARAMAAFALDVGEIFQ